VEEYQTTALWRAAFTESHCGNEQQTLALNDLLTALRTLESRVDPILAKIPESCRNLTLHDISHVHQLWGVASEICGSGYHINPLEGFVLGAAFLIHDAGLTAGAYPGGLNALKESSYYKDRVCALLRFQNDGAVPSEDAVKSASTSISERALFDTLRAVHAKRAETILETSNLHPLTGQPYSLFPDPDLFLDCGEIIGMVAASHHWPLDKVDLNFAEPRTAPAKFPWWPIDMVKLACILRTADACAIDERRARVMPFLLTDPEGVSRDHWFFQMYLNPGKCQGDSIVFHSKRPFAREHMSSWWVAFDAIRIADQELRTSDRLLRFRSQMAAHSPLIPFRAVRVDGADEPSRLKNLIRVSGWTPIDTSVRIDNPLALVERLGGRHLYGDDNAAPLRELIQNAADAVRARRNRAARLGSSFSGQIDVAVEFAHTDNRLHECILTVSDNGIGMPQEVLTGSLLDFGRSFWSTEEAALRYPGLTSDPKFQPTGRFGIGFYAIFVIADDVKVMSRSWDDGLSMIKTLHFRHGTKGRAELREYSAEEDGRLDPQHSTVVRARLNKLGWPAAFGSLSIRLEEREIRDVEHFWEFFERTARQLVFTLDVECNLAIGEYPATKLNNPEMLTLPTSDFAKIYNETFGDEARGLPYDEEEASRIEGIADENNIVHTRGLINSSGTGHGTIHIGGFTVFGAIDSVIKGVTARAPGTAARTVGQRVASSDHLKDWGEEQLKFVMSADISLEKKLGCIMNLVNIDVDITRHALLSKNGVLSNVADMIHSLPPDAKIFVVMQRPHPNSSWPPSLSNPSFHLWGIEDLRDLAHNILVGSPNFSAADRYNRILGSFDNPTNPNSGYAVLIKELRNAGYQITVTDPSTVILGKYFGPDGGHGRFIDRELVQGTLIKDYGIEILCKKPS
jgi:Histidine kinase-, DNA gyrase B-, and HSP90-like ATPase